MKKFFPWLGAAAIITVIFGTIYGTVQQSLRLNANDPQIQIAQDAASQLDNGAVLPSTKGDINIATSLDVFYTVYDKSGKPLYSTGELNEKLPTVPKGVLTASDNKNYSFVTLQPQKGVRLASVTVSSKKYYVVSARSLAEVENRESAMLHLVGYGWTASIVVLVLIYGMPFLGRGQSADPAPYKAPVTRPTHSSK